MIELPNQSTMVVFGLIMIGPFNNHEYKLSQCSLKSDGKRAFPKRQPSARASLKKVELHDKTHGLFFLPSGGMSLLKYRRRFQH